MNQNRRLILLDLLERNESFAKRQKELYDDFVKYEGFVGVLRGVDEQPLDVEEDLYDVGNDMLNVLDCLDVAKITLEKMIDGDGDV